MSLQIPSQSAMACAGEASAFHSLIFDAVSSENARDRNCLYMLQFVGVQEPKAKTLN